MPADFIDSNVILYLAGSDASKAGKAETLLRNGAVISVQVLNEVANVLHRKFGFAHDEIAEFLEMVKLLVEVRPLDLATHETGMSIAARFRLSIYDAMIVAAAMRAGCAKLYSEDMQDGFSVDGKLTIVNPFR